MKKRAFLKWNAAGVTFAVIATAGVMLTSRQSQAANDNNPTQDEKQKIQIGAKIAPVRLDLTGKDPNTVYLGSYIVNAGGGCNDCHTNPSYAVGGDPFRGQPTVVNADRYLAGGATFGPFTSRNLTPNHAGKPAGLSYAEFVQVIRHGTDFDNAHPAFGPLLQVMPWPVYANLTDRDLNAIYTYLSTIPCIEGDPGVNPSAPPPFRCRP